MYTMIRHSIKHWCEERNLARLKPLALKYLSTPATSAPIERVFSVGGHIFSLSLYTLCRVFSFESTACLTFALRSSSKVLPISRKTGCLGEVKHNCGQTELHCIHTILLLVKVCEYRAFPSPCFTCFNYYLC